MAWMLKWEGPGGGGVKSNTVTIIVVSKIVTERIKVGRIYLSASKTRVIVGEDVYFRVKVALERAIPRDAKEVENYAYGIYVNDRYQRTVTVTPPKGEGVFDSSFTLTFRHTGRYDVYVIGNDYVVYKREVHSV